ncbi:MAG: hypothetical protein ACR2RV_03220 [Verrucomicrobiales bacterium]
MRRRTFLAQCAALAAPRLAIAGQPRMPSEVAAAKRRAVDYLVGCQRADGSWTSTVYGAFRDGRALTPLVSLALEQGASASSSDAAALALDWIASRTSDITEMFSVHNASWILQGSASRDGHARLRRAMIRRLRQLQLNAANGWHCEHPYFGGWSYAPRAPKGAGHTAPFQQPILSASVLAVAGLGAAGVGHEEPVMRDALRFLRRCQNFARHRRRPSRFDDGGFFQLHDDPSRNKAGQAGTDRDGKTRQRSYTSATADGLRGLLLCGLAEDEPAVAAAAGWLDTFLNPDDVPDLRHYAAYSTAHASALLDRRGRTSAWRDQISRLLLEQQRPDGSWRNAAGEMREDDPLVATSLAVLSLT